MVFSPLAGGLLTGKVSHPAFLSKARQSSNPPCRQYNDGVPDDSRLAVEQEAQFKRKIEFLKSPEGQRQIAIIRKLSEFAEKGASPLSPLVLRLRASIALCLCLHIL